MDRTAPTGLQAQVSEEIRVMLTRRRLSANQLASELGWSQAQLSRKLNNQVSFSLEDLEKVAKTLKIKLIDLLPADARSTWNSFLDGAAA